MNNRETNENIQIKHVRNFCKWTTMFYEKIPKGKTYKLIKTIMK